jgi:PleD family two-component response regulator
VVAPDITNSGLISLAKRINFNLSKEKIKALNSSLSITVSFGCSVIKQDEH